MGEPIIESEALFRSEGDPTVYLVRSQVQGVKPLRGESKSPRATVARYVGLIRENQREHRFKRVDDCSKDSMVSPDAAASLEAEDALGC